MKKTLALLLLFVAVQGVAFGQSAYDIKRIDTFIDSTMKQWHVPGLSVAIVKNGEVIFEKGYGFRDITTNKEVTPNTLFYIASVTKTFTSTLAMMAADQKKLNIDEPLRKYFPEFSLYDSLASPKISMRDMLCHRTGLPREKFFVLNYEGNRKDMRKYMKYFEPNLDFRTMFQYTNEPFTVAGDMIADRYETTWENLVVTKLFQPIGMNSSLFSYKEMCKTSDYALPYNDWSGVNRAMHFYDSEILGSAGCIISNVSDLSKWLLFHLNKGKVGNTQHITPAQLARAYNPQIPLPTTNKYPELIFPSYCIGWFADDYRNHVHIHHEGALYGYSSLISFLPNEKIGVVVLANLHATPLTTVVERYIYDNLLGLKPTDWNSRLLEQEKTKMDQINKMKNQVDTTYKPDSKLNCSLKEYVGLFKSKGYGNIKIIQEGDSLYTVMLGIRCPLRHHHDEVFELYHPEEEGGWAITFTSNERKRITHFTIDIGNRVKDIKFEKEI